MKDELLKQEWLKEQNCAFKGWDFSHVDGRMQSEALPWDYADVVRQYLRETDALLDMGTGDGEFLLSLHHVYRLTSVTEGYPPNVAICETRLTPLGITVKQTFSDGRLPYADQSFDMVINRHVSFDPSEVFRVLKPNGYLITQQVGGENNRRLSELLIRGFEPNFSHHYAAHNAALLKDAGFDVLRSDEAFPTVRFFDVGALVYYAKNIPWEFPGFSVESSYDGLCECCRIIEQDGCIEAAEHRFLIVAVKTLHGADGGKGEKFER